MPYRPYDCRDRTCGADDCRTCHPENFDGQGRLLPVCDWCGERVASVDDEGVCDSCRLSAETDDNVGLCPICGVKTVVAGETKDGRLIGRCGDAFTREQWEADDDGSE